MSADQDQDKPAETAELIRANATQKVAMSAAPAPSAGKSAGSPSSRLRRPAAKEAGLIVQNVVSSPELAHAEGQDTQHEARTSQLRRRARADLPSTLLWPSQELPAAADPQESFEQRLLRRMQAVREENEKLGLAVSHLEAGVSR